MSEIAERLGKLTAGTEAGGPPGSEGQAANRRAGRRRRDADAAF